MSNDEPNEENGNKIWENSKHIISVPELKKQTKWKHKLW